MSSGGGGGLVVTECSTAAVVPSTVNPDAVAVLRDSQMDTTTGNPSTTINSLSTTGGGFVPAKLQLCSGASMIPHPEKAHRGGEDALFLHSNGLGVADGVGSWALQGIDAGLFARSLMLECRKALDAGMLEPGKILARAHDNTKARGLRGSSTAVVIVLEDDVLHSANLGDSSYMVIRGDEIYHKEKELTHAFNTPYQLGHAGSRADRASDAVLRSVYVQPGDVIIAGSDGLFDNLYTSRILELVAEILPARIRETATTRAHTASPGRGADDKDDTVMEEAAMEKEQSGLSPEELSDIVQQLAERIAEEAHRDAASKTKRVPFGDAAGEHGYAWDGGKMDDITVCVSLVTGLSLCPTAKL